MYAALASQKNHMAVYLTAIYLNNRAREEFVKEFRFTGKRIDYGKSCVRFRRLEDLPLDLIGKVISSMSIQEFILQFKELRESNNR